MADSDSGTHVTDIASASENGGQDDTDSRKEGIFRPLADTGGTNQENEQEHRIQLIPSPMCSPRLTRFKNAINPDLNEVQPAEETTRGNETPASHNVRGPYVTNHVTTRENHAPNHMSRTNQSLDHGVSHLTFNKGPRKLHLPSRHASRADAPGHVIAAHVHTTPRSFWQFSEEAMPRRHALHRQRSLPPREPNLGILGGPLRRAESFSDRVNGFESLNGQPQGVRSAYDFLDANRRQYHKVKPKTSRQVDAVDIELGIAEDDELREEQMLEDKPWVPTGIYFVFLSTLWTAVLKIVDTVEKNGPAVCAPGEEARLWACAGALALLQGISEALWQRKSLFKALFSMVCLLSYMLISHAAPLSCRLGLDMLQDINKWQAALNCFIGALLGVLVYRSVQMSVQSHKARKETRRRRRKRNERSDDEYSFDGVPD